MEASAADPSADLCEDYDDDSLDLATLKAAGDLDVFELPDDDPMPDERDFWMEDDDIN